jgi:hypothetical protein
MKYINFTFYFIKNYKIKNKFKGLRVDDAKKLGIKIKKS